MTPYAKVIILVLIILPVPVAIYLMVVNGLIFLIALPIFYIFITWLLVGGCVNGRYASKRINRMGEALETWNRYVNIRNIRKYKSNKFVSYKNKLKLHIRPWRRFYLNFL